MTKHEQQKVLQLHIDRTRRVYEQDAGHKAMVHAYLLSLLPAKQKTSITRPSKARPMQIFKVAA